jgi:acyl-coenzyme A synthetase/AMP-(fatty) acid ligase
MASYGRLRLHGRPCRITGRVDEFINRGGEKVPPLEVEAAICHSKAFLMWPWWEFQILTLVKAQPVARTSTLSALNHLADRLADYKIPVRLFLVDELPRKANGKIVRSRVHAIIAQDLTD